jgi:hypothetical protein
LSIKNYGINSENDAQVWNVFKTKTVLKPRSIETYSAMLKTFCRETGVSNPFALLNLGIEKIEDITEEWISQNRDVRAHPNI